MILTTALLSDQRAPASILDIGEQTDVSTVLSSVATAASQPLIHAGPVVKALISETTIQNKKSVFTSLLRHYPGVPSTPGSRCSNKQQLVKGAQTRASSEQGEQDTRDRSFPRNKNSD
ncbi:hypothetical protein EVAR_32942_1 [Eumeta japonica]|uniref:Uncharacterized protein n=1 Tax=Eumeta variegata TaxID=151549 RepID=A0A4C1X2S4_EUMVA|nr:hypothetical protein EVAR_32942_1 [Eumeta japonica]